MDVAEMWSLLSKIDHRDVAVQVEFERQTFETRISLDRQSLETRRFQAMGQNEFNVQEPHREYRIASPMLYEDSGSDQ
jgi:hypothetical protein